jgi:DNA-binding NtrC family response regulator
MSAMTYRLLFVDDEPAIRALLELELARMDFQVTSTATGEEALQLLEQTPFHVVVLDLILHEIDGLDLLELIKHRHPRMPVVMLSGVGYTPDAMEEARARGANGYVSKGLAMSHLVTELHRVLGTNTREVSAV